MSGRTRAATSPQTGARLPALPAEPTLIGAPPPPVARDRMVHTWVASMALSWFGDAVWTVALAWTAVHTLSPAMAGVVLGAETLPQAVFVLLGGVIADRWDTRRILVTGRLAQGAVLLAGAAAWAAGVRGAPFLITMGVLLGTATGLTLPAGATLGRQLVRPADLATVSGWNQIGARVARLLGAPAGGVAVAVVGPRRGHARECRHLRGGRRRPRVRGASALPDAQDAPRVLDGEPEGRGGIPAR